MTDTQDIIDILDDWIGEAFQAKDYDRVTLLSLDRMLVVRTVGQEN